MKYREKYLHCGEYLLQSLKVEIAEISKIIKTIEWDRNFSLSYNSNQYEHQRAYNKAFEIEFIKYGWETQPLLADSPKLIGDFRKNLVFVEIQFGNSSTLYRDFYKFQYGLQNGLLSLAVLIVPENEYNFFPSRPESVRNMANFELSLRYFTVLPISVPTWVIGVLPEH